MGPRLDAEVVDRDLAAVSEQVVEALAKVEQGAGVDFAQPALAHCECSARYVEIHAVSGNGIATSVRFGSSRVMSGNPMRATSRLGGGSSVRLPVNANAGTLLVAPDALLVIAWIRATSSSVGASALATPVAEMINSDAMHRISTLRRRGLADVHEELDDLALERGRIRVALDVDQQDRHGLGCSTLGVGLAN